MSGMNYDRAFKKINSNYATGARGDIDIADFQKLDAISAHLLLEFEPNIGRPTSNDVERYMQKTFEGRVLPVMASMSVKKNCVSIIAQMAVPTRPMADMDNKSALTPVVAGMMYIDNQLGDVWNVMDTPAGEKVLAKQSKENIEQIIAARRNRMFVTKSSTVSLASLASVKEMLTAGMTVKAWHQGKIGSFELIEASKGGFKAKSAEGKEVLLAKEGIVDLQQMADAGPNEDAALVKYFSEAYGDKAYAKGMTKK